MANIIAQKTKMDGPTIQDNFIWDDDTVTDARTGDPKPNAVVTHNDDGSISVDISGNGMQDVNPYPDLGRVWLERVPGWQGNLGWQAYLLGWNDALVDPGVYALAVYNEPDGQAYSFTTGGFVWYPDAIHPETGEAGMWGATCPAGFEPGQNDVYFGMLYASISYSTFTLRDYINEETFVTGGTAPNTVLRDIDGDGKIDAVVVPSTRVGGNPIVTLDADSINIDYNGDGEVDIIITRNPSQQGNNGI